MLENLKNKLPGMLKNKKESKPMPGVEIEIGEEEEEGAPEGEDMEEEEVSVGELAQFSDEELKAELEKRGMKVASGGSAITALPEISEEEEQMPAPKAPKVR